MTNRKRAPKGIQESLMDMLSHLYADLKKEFISRVPEFYGETREYFIKAKTKYYGEKMCILGLPAVGKTTLLAVMKNPEISDEDLRKYNKTEIDDSIGDIKGKWNLVLDDGDQEEFEFKIRSAIDVGGETMFREKHWLKVAKEAKIILYVFDYKKYLDNKEEVTNRMIEDFDWLGDKVIHLTKGFKIVIVANKVDLLCDRRTYAQFESEHFPKLLELKEHLIAGFPRQYKNSICSPTFMSLYDRGIRNMQFADIMLSLMGEKLIDLIKKNKQNAANRKSS